MKRPGGVSYKALAPADVWVPCAGLWGGGWARRPASRETLVQVWTEEEQFSKPTPERGIWEISTEQTRETPDHALFKPASEMLKKYHFFSEQVNCVPL